MTSAVRHRFSGRDFASEPLRWGILGGGNMARRFASGVALARLGEVTSVATRSAAQLDGATFGRARHHVGYHELLRDPDVEAVHIALPHSLHAQWAEEAASHGKQILCEKPIALNHAQALSAFDAVDRAGVILAEGFMFRVQKQTLKLVELVAGQAIGRVRQIDSTFGFHKQYDPEGRHFAASAGGGAILDVGCYPVSMARLIAGVAGGEKFADPVRVQACARFNEAGTDAHATALLDFPDGIQAMLSASISQNQGQTTRIYGDLGFIEVRTSWLCQGDAGGQSTLTLVMNDGSVTPFEITEPRRLFAVEADNFATALREGQVSWPAMERADTLGNMKTLDAWRACIGLRYPGEATSGSAISL